MKISKKNKTVLIWVGAILLILIALYIFNSYFLKEKFEINIDEYKKEYKSQIKGKNKIGIFIVKSETPIAIWKDKKNIINFSWILDIEKNDSKTKKIIGDSKYIWWNKNIRVTSHSTFIESNKDNISEIIIEPPKPTPPSNPQSQADCNLTGLIFKENKCKPPENQNDCMVNLYGSIYDEVKKNCLGKITEDVCMYHYGTRVYRNKDKTKSCDKKKSFNATCSRDSECISNKCKNKKCNKGKYLEKCIENNDCKSNYCSTRKDNSKVCMLYPPGMSCSKPTECASNICSNGKCSKSENEYGCDNNNECVSGYCKEYLYSIGNYGECRSVPK